MLPFEEEHDKLFQPIIQQFQNATIQCRIIQELTNWHIDVTAIVMIGDEKHIIVRSTEDLSQLSEEMVAFAIQRVVFVLRQAICQVFVNPNASSLEYKGSEINED